MKKNFSELKKRHGSAVPRYGRWLLDKDNRASLAWFGSLVGICFVVAYQMTLGVGFTPQVTFAEGAFVLGKAALIGLLLFASLYAGVFAPAASLRMVEIDVDKIEQSVRKNAIFSLMRRCVFAQVFGGFFSTAIFLFCNADEPHHMWLAFASAALCIFALIISLSAARLHGETKAELYLSIAVISFFAFFSLSMFVLISGLKDDLGSLAKVTMSWLALTIVSGILSTVRKRELLLTSVGALLVFVLILGFLGQLGWPFRAVAVVVGIAQPGPVTVVVPEAVCQQIQGSVLDFQDVSCSGRGVGVLRDVAVLNSWGSRWLILLRKGDKTRTLSFDGSGAIIARDRASVDERKSDHPQGGRG